MIIKAIIFHIIFSLVTYFILKRLCDKRADKLSKINNIIIKKEFISFYLLKLSFIPICNLIVLISQIVFKDEITKAINKKIK